MSQLQLSLLMAVACTAVLAIIGYRPYVDECRGRVRQTLAAFLFIGILALVVFYPVTSFGEAQDIDPQVIWFPILLLGHFLLVLFLLLWWRLSGARISEFLHVSSAQLWSKVRLGLIVGCGGWVLTLMMTAAAAGVVASMGRLTAPTEVSPLIVWLAELPVANKLIIIGAAMTVEEAFFRGFLQPRIGLLGSSLLFTLSHFSYGLPIMIVGVFTISLVIGRAWRRTRDLLPCIIAHGVFDSVQLLIVLPLAVRVWGAPA